MLLVDRDANLCFRNIFRFFYIFRLIQSTNKCQKCMENCILGWRNSSRWWKLFPEDIFLMTSKQQQHHCLDVLCTEWMKTAEPKLKPFDPTRYYLNSVFWIVKFFCLNPLTKSIKRVLELFSCWTRLCTYNLQPVRTLNFPEVVQSLGWRLDKNSCKN